MFLSESIEKYIEWKMGRYTRAAENYSIYLSKFLNFLDNKKLRGITLNDIGFFRNHLEKKHYAPATVSYHLIAVRDLFKYYFLLKENDLNYNLILIPKYISKQRVFVNEQDIENISDKMSENNFKEIRDKLIVNFLFSSGVRVSELCGLDVQEIDTIEQQATIVTKKNNQMRLIFWNEATRSLLSKYLSLRGTMAQDNALFINIRNFRRITPRSVQRIIKMNRNEKAITPHSFRHGFAAKNLKNFVGVREIQLMLGHLHLQSSEVYMRYDNRDLKKEYQRVWNKACV